MIIYHISFGMLLTVKKWVGVGPKTVPIPIFVFLLSLFCYCQYLIFVSFSKNKKR